MFKYTKNSSLSTEIFKYQAWSSSANFVLHAKLFGSNTEHFKTVKTSFPEGALVDMRDASYGKLFFC